ncbi:prepilin peptidase [Brucella intermedia]|uniref:A24 family peptidase n=1 Tax=Brucella intermedia TaxID=94625 RepID=UPI000469B95E
MINFFALIFFPACMSAAIVHDAIYMRIPNWLCASLFVGYVGIIAWAHPPLSFATMHFSAFICVLIAGFILFVTGVLGGGDSKLLAVTVLWIGWEPALIDYLALVGIIGGLLALFALVTRFLNAYLALPLWSPVWLTQQGYKIPFGVSLGAAGLIVYPDLAAALLP